MPICAGSEVGLARMVLLLVAAAASVAIAASSAAQPNILFVLTVSSLSWRARAARPRLPDGARVSLVDLPLHDSPANGLRQLSHAMTPADCGLTICGG